MWHTTTDNQILIHCRLYYIILKNTSANIIACYPPLQHIISEPLLRIIPIQSYKLCRQKLYKEIKNCNKHTISNQNSKEIFKKVLQFCFVSVIMNELTKYSKTLTRRCLKWQSVISVVRMSNSASRFLTHTDVPTEHGSQTFSVLRLLLTALQRECTLALVACVQVRLQELSD